MEKDAGPRLGLDHDGDGIFFPFSCSFPSHLWLIYTSFSRFSGLFLALAVILDYGHEFLFASRSKLAREKHYLLALKEKEA